MKFLTKVKYPILSVLMLLPFVTIAQEIIEDEKETVEVVKAIDSTQRIKIDGVAAVVGDFVVLDSDIDKQFLQLDLLYQKQQMSIRTLQSLKDLILKV